MKPPYFPVEVPHRMPGPLYELGHEAAGAQYVELDPDPAAHLGAKADAANDRSNGPHRSPDSDADGRIVSAWLRETIAREHPTERGRFADRRTLEDLVLGIQEDLVIMRRGAGDEPATAKAVYLHVSFPTGWCPACAHGQSFLGIHGPVPKLRGFEKADRVDVARHLFEEGKTAVRFVWTLTPDARLDRRRCALGRHRTVSASWDQAPDPCFRVERQVIVPLSETLSVFLIRIHRHPVRALSQSQLATVRESVASMPPALQAYKGFAGHLDAIARILESGVG